MNVVLISIDNLRFDCVGYQKDKSFLKKYGVLNFLSTPIFDSIAKKSLCFTNAFSVSSYTTCAHASLLTGVYPQRHKVRGFMDIQEGRLAKNLMTLAEVFQENNYHTIMLSDVSSFFTELNLHRGFEKTIEINENKLFKFVERKKNDKKNFFIFAHFFDVHFPFLHSSNEKYNKDYYLALKEAYKGFGGNFPANLKDGVKLWNRLWRKDNRSNIYNLLPWYIKGVSKFDQGRFKDFLNNLFKLINKENTLLVIFSDHGEGKCNSNPAYFSHAGGLYDSVVRIPLIIHIPRFRRQVIVDNLVSLVDVYPTILDVVFKKKKDPFLPKYSFDGLSLMDKNRLKKRRYIYMEVSRSNKPETLHIKDAEWILRERCIRTKNFKYLVKGKPERLFDKNFYQLPNDKFLKELYRAVFYRFEDDLGFKTHLKALERKSKTKIELVRQFLKSPEHQERKNFLYFDLQFDKEEEVPLDPVITKDKNYPKYLKKILKKEMTLSEKVEIDSLPFREVFLSL